MWGTFFIHNALFFEHLPQLDRDPQKVGLATCTSLTLPRAKPGTQGGKEGMCEYTLTGRDTEEFGTDDQNQTVMGPSWP